MDKEKLYKISFVNQDKVYEIYAHSVGSSGMFGFVEISELCFGKRSAVVLDPSEDALRQEFAHVKTTHIPMNSIIRIDEVSKQGSAKSSDLPTTGSNKIHPFPVSTDHRSGEQ